MTKAEPVLVAAPGMTMGEIAAASTAKFDMPRPDDEKGIIQPADAHRVEIKHPRSGIAVPAGLFTVVDVLKGMAYRVTATPQLDYLNLQDTIDLVRLIVDGFDRAGWEAIETPIFDALPIGLPQKTNVVLGEWKLDSWGAELRAKQALEVGSDAARYAGFPEGGWLNTLVVWDEKLLPK